VTVRSIVHKGLKRLYLEDDPKGVPGDAAGKLRRMLAFLDDIEDQDELRNLPSWDAHILTGDRTGTWSLKIT
jgi:proteic killer suppression protein